MPIREFLVNWDTASSSGGTSVLYFTDGVSADDQQNAIATWLSALDPILASSTGWTVAGSGRVLDGGSGSLVDEWTLPGSISGAGSGTQPPVAGPAQLLYRWITPSFKRGRKVKGRTFIPGVVVQGPEFTEFTTAENAAQSMLDPLTRFVIWSRPQTTPEVVIGSFHPVTEVSIWNEWAVQRKRRN